MRGFDFGQVFFCDPFVASAFDRRRVIDLWPIPKHLRTQSPYPRLKPLVPWIGIPLLMAFFKKLLDFILKTCDYISCNCRQPEVLVYSCFKKGRRKKCARDRLELLVQTISHWSFITTEENLPKNVFSVLKRFSYSKSRRWSGSNSLSQLRISVASKWIDFLLFKLGKRGWTHLLVAWSHLQNKEGIAILTGN